MDYLKVALRSELAAEDISQAATRATIHLYDGHNPASTMCGKVDTMDTVAASTDRVVSCADCLSAYRRERDTPPHNNILRVLSRVALSGVSSEECGGIERRHRPRFIVVPAALFNGEETMKHYTNVRAKAVAHSELANLALIHALFEGSTTTACGALGGHEVDVVAGSPVSCKDCMKAIMNQQRASDHRMPLVPVPAPVLHHNFSTHHKAWRRGLEIAAASFSNEADRTYWQHELAAFDMAYRKFDHSLATGADDMPDAIHHGGPVPKHRPQPRKTTRDVLTEFSSIIENCDSRMIGDGSGEREYILSAEDIATLRSLRDAFVAETIIDAQKVVNDADLLDKLRRMCGYVEDGSSEFVTIGQDDATREWGISVGADHRMQKRRHYHGTSFHQAIRAAAEKELDVEPEAEDLAQPRDKTFEIAVVAVPASSFIEQADKRNEMRALLLKVKDRFSAVHAKNIINAVGKAQKMDDIDPANYDKVIEACNADLNPPPRFGTVDVKIKRVHPGAKLPTYGTPDSACFDFYAIKGGMVGYGDPATFDIGIQIEPEPGYGLLVFPRSGLAFNEDVRLANCVAVIDGDYRKNLKIKLTMDMPGMAYTVKDGERIAQGMFVPITRAVFSEASELSVTQRDGGMGSTGKF
jgi:dUTP pyrophosphatase